MEIMKGEKLGTTRSKIHTTTTFSESHVTSEQVLLARDAAWALAHNRLCSGQSVRTQFMRHCVKESIRSLRAERLLPTRRVARGRECAQSPHAPAYVCVEPEQGRNAPGHPRQQISHFWCVSKLTSISFHLWEQKLTFCGERTIEICFAPRILLCKLIKSRCIRCCALSLLFIFKVFLSLSRLR